jgi:hypothetical protein
MKIRNTACFRQTLHSESHKTYKQGGADCTAARKKPVVASVLKLSGHSVIVVVFDDDDNNNNSVVPLY